MAIITISRGSYSKGKEIAEKVAAKLGYECLAREALLEVSEYLKIPEAKLIKAVHDAPSIFDRIVRGKERYIAHIQAALTRRVQKDNVVYHGFAGQFFLRGISHVLNVRITAYLGDRIEIVMERDKVGAKEALRILKYDDEQRRKWSQYLYGIDTDDPSLYDLMIYVKKISADDAVDLICRTAQLTQFQATPDSQKAMDDLVLASIVKSQLVDSNPDVAVRADNGVVFVTSDSSFAYTSILTKEITRIASAVDGVKEVKVEVVGAPFAFHD